MHQNSISSSTNNIKYICRINWKYKVGAVGVLGKADTLGTIPVVSENALGTIPVATENNMSCNIGWKLVPIMIALTQIRNTIWERYFMQKYVRCKLNSVQLAVLAALIMLIGDFIAFIAAVLALQEQQNNDNGNSSCELHQEIQQLQNQLDCIKQKIR